MEPFLIVGAAIGATLFVLVAARQLVRALKLAKTNGERLLLAAGMGLWGVFMLTHAVGLVEADVSVGFLEIWLVSNLIVAVFLFPSTRKGLISTLIAAVTICAIGACLVWPLLSGPPEAEVWVPVVFTMNMSLLGIAYGLALFFMRSRARPLKSTDTDTK